MKPILDRCQNCFNRCIECKSCEAGEKYKPLGASVILHPVVKRYESCSDICAEFF